MNKLLKDEILYEIYPATFMDGNGDGIGDFKGIIEKLDYVKDLGATMIWLNPFYKSPFRDGGYDVADYCSIDPKFGDFSDFEAFIKKCKELKLKVLVDLVVGHTSTEHKWFQESAKKDRNKYSDYYMWTNNLFTTYKNKTILGVYERDGGYFVNYYGCQPALNFGWYDTEEEVVKNDPYSIGGNWKMSYKDERVKPVRDEIVNVMKFWLSKGVDGFRVDMAGHILKGVDWDTNDKEKLSAISWLWHYMIGEVKKDYPNCIMLAEWCCPKNSTECGFDFDYLGHDNIPYDDLYRCEKGSNLLPFFEQGQNYFSKNGLGSCKRLAKYLKQLYKDVDGKGYFSLPTGCHDEIRMATGVKNLDVIKTVYAFYLTLKHIPFIYMGDEIGIKHNRELSKDGGSIRTGCRTPMQWNNEKNRGFSANDEVYLPTNNDKGISVEEQLKDKKSLLNTVKALIKLRKEYSCFNAEANIEFIETSYPLVYKRFDDTFSATVMINPSDKVIEKKAKIAKLLYSENADIINDKIILKAQSFVIFLNI